jgi:hypothetical protein
MHSFNRCGFWAVLGLAGSMWGAIPASRLPKILKAICQSVVRHLGLIFLLLRLPLDALKPCLQLAVVLPNDQRRCVSTTVCFGVFLLISHS